MKISAVSLSFFACLLFFQCKNSEPKDKLHIKIQGEIENIELQSLYLLNHLGDTLNTIDVDQNNGFAVKLGNLKEGYFALLHGQEKSELYLTQGDSLHLKMSADTLYFTGKGKERNLYLYKKYSPEFNWLTNYYKTQQKGDLTVYFHDSYIKKLNQLLKELPSEDSQFLHFENKELDYELVNWLLQNQISLESNQNLDISIAKKLDWAKSFKIQNEQAIFKSKRYISLIAKILLTKNLDSDFVLKNYYDKIKHPSLKTHFLSSLTTPLFKQLQYGEDNFNKAVIVQSFINDNQPNDSIGYNVFNLYHKFNQAEGKLASFSYEDTNGEIISLDDFRGKYVLIDFWATWCVNCIKEFPYLKTVEEHLNKEDIEFLSISIDKQDAKDKWKKFVADKGLGNVQLFSPSQGYPEKNKITDPFKQLIYLNSYYLGIPHYTLIDPQGRIVDAFFYRPSNEKFEKYISDLLDS